MNTNKQVDCIGIHMPAKIETLTKDTIKRLHDWTIAHGVLKEAKKNESNLRKLVDRAIFAADTKKGTYTFDLGEGYAIKKSLSETWSLDTEETEKAIIAICKRFPDVGETICDELFSYSYKIDKEAYANLPKEIRDMLSVALTIKTGTPTITYVTPKSDNDDGEDNDA